MLAQALSDEYNIAEVMAGVVGHPVREIGESVRAYWSVQRERKAP